MSVRSLAGLLFVALALALAGCAEKKVLPATPTGANFPDYIFPSVPGTLGPATALDDHQRAWQVLQSGDPRGAARAFSAVLKQAPSFYPAEAGLGYTELAQKDPQTAVTHFDRALARDPAYAPALVGKGDALLSMNRPTAALEAFEAALKANPNLAGLRSRVDVLKFRAVQQEVETARKDAEAGKLDEARRAYADAIAASPESAFLYRELAGVDHRAGDTTAALAHAERAAQLDPSDARPIVMMAEIYEAAGQWTQAADAYAAANAREPAEALAAKAEAMRAKSAFDAMPDEYRAIEAAPSITRAQLAALIGVRLEPLLRRSKLVNGSVVTDTRSNWAAPWILAVVRTGVMEPYPNHTFQPAGIIRRSDLAQAVSRVLMLIAAEQPRLAARWRDARPRFADVSPAHLSYPAAARAVSSGVMDVLDNNTFQLTRLVTGTEAVQAVGRLEALAKGTPK